MKKIERLDYEIIVAGTKEKKIPSRKTGVEGIEFDKEMIANVSINISDKINELVDAVNEIENWIKKTEYDKHEVKQPKGRPQKGWGI